MKYRKKPVVIDATRWWKNGDHPQDESKEMCGAYPNDTFLSEGTVVRYFRRPDGVELNPCANCGRRMHDHGWIDTLEGGHIVCPGDWIITGVKGQFYPCKPDVFAATYEKV